MKAVFDTNILVSALLTPGGTCDRAVRLAVRGALPCAVDSRLVAEYEHVLYGSAIPIPSEEVDELLDGMRARAEVVTAPPLGARLPHASDLPFLEVAHAAGAILVTGNVRHFPKNQRAGVAVMGPDELLDLLREMA
ncbi:MAG TPA: PIN domain-containing protein [Planctomycetota bacterium]|nr:PIN domain-containing protein [Planctomycetota bacterium]